MLHPNPNSTPDHAGHSQGFERRAPDGEALIQQVLHGKKRLEIFSERARNRGINQRIAAKCQQILIVVKLFARGTKLQRAITRAAKLGID